jgi:hypothetical protein
MVRTTTNSRAAWNGVPPTPSPRPKAIPVVAAAGLPIRRGQ